MPGISDLNFILAQNHMPAALWRQPQIDLKRLWRPFIMRGLARAYAAVPRMDGQSSRVFANVTEPKSQPQLEKCAMPTERSGAVVWFEADLISRSPPDRNLVCPFAPGRKYVRDNAYGTCLHKVAAYRLRQDICLRGYVILAH